uniref:Ovule protein n=1 Tax=Heterorhabditis bacteriophora TaxID=37862 RepID=A0A1I7X1L6_HETBA
MDPPSGRFCGFKVMYTYNKINHIEKSIGFRSSKFDKKMSLPQKSGNCYRHSSGVVLAP